MLEGISLALHVSTAKNRSSHECTQPQRPAMHRLTLFLKNCKACRSPMTATALSKILWCQPVLFHTFMAFAIVLKYLPPNPKTSVDTKSATPNAFETIRLILCLEHALSKQKP